MKEVVIYSPTQAFFVNAYRDGTLHILIGGVILMLAVGIISTMICSNYSIRKFFRNVFHFDIIRVSTFLPVCLACAAGYSFFRYI